MKFALTLALAGIYATTEASPRHAMHHMYRSVSQNEKQRVRNIKAKFATESELNPQEYYYDATIDHFTNHGAGSDTY